MVVLWPPSSMVDAVMPTIEQALKNHKLLTDKMFELTAVSPGPYALFHHNSNAVERMLDIKLIITRIAENRKLITKLHLKEDTLRGETEVDSQQFQEVWQKKEVVHHHMRLDMESLFLFGNLLLEQWTYVILYLVGEKDPGTFDFAKLMTKLQGRGDKGLLQSLWDNHHDDMLWLLYQIRNYRNIFIEHVREPRQRGTSMETYGDSFRIAGPTPVDWISRDDIEQAVNKVRYLAPKWAKHPDMAWYTIDARQMLEIIFFYIDEIKEHYQREQVWSVWKKIGGWTFSYDMIAFRLMRFIVESELTMLDIISLHPEAINVGAAQISQS